MIRIGKQAALSLEPGGLSGWAMTLAMGNWATPGIAESERNPTTAEIAEAVSQANGFPTRLVSARFAPLGDRWIFQFQSATESEPAVELEPHSNPPTIAQDERSSCEWVPKRFPWQGLPEGDLGVIGMDRIRQAQAEVNECKAEEERARRYLAERKKATTLATAKLLAIVRAETEPAPLFDGIRPAPEPDQAAPQWAGFSARPDAGMAAGIGMVEGIDPTWLKPLHKAGLHTVGDVVNHYLETGGILTFKPAQVEAICAALDRFRNERKEA